MKVTAAIKPSWHQSYTRDRHNHRPYRNDEPFVICVAVFARRYSSMVSRGEAIGYKTPTVLIIDTLYEESALVRKIYVQNGRLAVDAKKKKPLAYKIANYSLLLLCCCRKMLCEASRSLVCCLVRWGGGTCPVAETRDCLLALAGFGEWRLLDGTTLP